MTTAAHADYWERFYSGTTSSQVPREPSAFARWVQARLAPGQVVVEFGFGTARDAVWFARSGHQVLGFDYAQSAVEQAEQTRVQGGLDASFMRLDLYDSTAVALAAGSIRNSSTAPAVYGRFLLHSLEDDGRQNLLDCGASVLASGGELYLEFRTGLDKGAQHVFGDDHFRTYLDPQIVEHEITTRGGVVQHSEAGHGLAPYKSEDPHVARIVATWTS